MNPQPPRAVSAVMIMPEEISLDCPVCSSSHVLTRGLDFDEDRSGVWRLTERPGFICDCAIALIGDFRLELVRTSDHPHPQQQARLGQVDVEADGQNQERQAEQ